jgi:hypothetical protein
LGEQLPAQRAGSNADRRFAGTGPLEDAADGPEVLDRAVRSAARARSR